MEQDVNSTRSNRPKLGRLIVHNDDVDDEI